MKKIAITGAAGIVGTGLRHELRRRGYALQLLDLKPVTDLSDNEKSAIVDITDQAQLAVLLRGCDAIIHLAACTTDAPWPELVQLSVQGTISLFDAARDAGVARIVYASSHHVVGMHARAPHGPRLGTDVQLRPDSRYGVGKAFGEAISAMYACKYGMQVLAIRIGNVNSRPIDRRRLGNWLSWRDLGQLVSIGLEHPALVYSVVYGISDATGRHYDNAAAYALGYQPEDASVAAYEEQVYQKDPPPQAGSDASRCAAELTLGGTFSQSEYLGSTQRLLPG